MNADERRAALEGAEEATAERVRDAVRAILNQHGTTMADAQRGAYKYTDAGVYLAWKLDDGSHIYSGDERESRPQTADRVVDIGVGSIVEGSDAEVPLRWLDLPRRCHYELETAEDAVAEYWRIVQGVNKEACDLWHEEHGDGSA